MGLIFNSQPKKQRCFLPIGKNIGGGRYQCFWCTRKFPNKAAWARHAQGR